MSRSVIATGSSGATGSGANGGAVGGGGGVTGWRAWGGTRGPFPIDALFVLDGAEPLTAGVEDWLRCDRPGYFMTGPDLLQTRADRGGRSNT